MTLNRMLYGSAPLRRSSIAELSRSAPVWVVLDGDAMPHDGARTLVVGQDLDDGDGRVERAFRAIAPRGPYLVVDGRVELSCPSHARRSSAA
ncbi:MAG TPA: hypothetical protein VF824_22770 [Thermoanaerobaculia bacterium]|jgi:hypothetical protein